jgi:hypothetical protein
MQNMEWRCLLAQAYDCMTISRIDCPRTSACLRPGEENMRAKKGISVIWTRYVEQQLCGRLTDGVFVSRSAREPPSPPPENAAGIQAGGQPVVLHRSAPGPSTSSSVALSTAGKAWMAGTSPAKGVVNCIERATNNRFRSTGQPWLKAGHDDPGRDCTI